MFDTTVLFAYKTLKEMDKAERIRAYYFHAALRYVQNSPMTNTTLLKQFAVDVKNIAIISRIIAKPLESKLIRCRDESLGTNARKCLPFWA